MWYNIYEVMKMENVKVNNIIEGQVTGVTKYGIFVSLCDNYTGMIHISEVSNKFVSNLEERFKVGDVIKVKILSINEDKLQVRLSLKRISRVNKMNKSIKEKGNGFQPLSQKMPEWINKKIKDLEKNSNIA